MRAEALAVRYGLAAADSKLVDASSYMTNAPIHDQSNGGDSRRWSELARELLVGHEQKENGSPK
jgi:hypothetical protein